MVGWRVIERDIFEKAFYLALCLVRGLEGALWENVQNADLVNRVV